jgi:hypothetical protein
MAVYRCQCHVGPLLSQAHDCITNVVTCLCVALSSFRTFTAVTRFQSRPGHERLQQSFNRHRARIFTTVLQFLKRLGRRQR